MSSQDARRKAIRAYKEREETGGLYRVVNLQTGWKSPVAATPNLQGQRNKFQFAQRTHTRFEEMLRGEWETYGPEAFAFEEVERLVKKPEMTTKEFREELEALLALHQEANT